MDLSELLVSTARAFIILAALAFINERIVKHVVTLIQEAFPVLAGRNWIAGVLAMFTGTGLGLLATFDPFSGLFVSVWVGKTMSGLLIGGGSNLVHDVYDYILALLAKWSGQAPQVHSEAVVGGTPSE